MNAYFSTPVMDDHIVHTFAGVRPLYDETGNEAMTEVTRDYVFDLEDRPGEPPLLNIYGGKLTTSRKLAEQALERLKPVLRFSAGPWTEGSSLPGGKIVDADFDGFLMGLRARYPWMPLADLRRMARAYGTRVETILGEARSREDLGQAFGFGLCEAELAYLHANEWAETAEDVLWRRSKLGLHLDPPTRQAVADWFRQSAAAKTA